MQAAVPDSAWLALGVTLLLAAVAVFWRSVHLRGRKVRELAEPVDLARTGLAERALEEFRSLQGELNALVPPDDEPFDPTTVVLDPAKLVDPAKRGLRIVRRQSRVDRQYRQLLSVCSIAKYLSATFCLLLAGLLLSYYFAFATVLLWVVLFWGCVAAAVAGIVVVAVYAGLTTKVDAAIERSRPGPGAAGGEA